MGFYNSNYWVWVRTLPDPTQSNGYPRSRGPNYRNNLRRRARTDVPEIDTSLSHLIHRSFPYGRIGLLHLLMLIWHLISTDILQLQLQSQLINRTWSDSFPSRSWGERERERGREWRVSFSSSLLDPSTPPFPFFPLGFRGYRASRFVRWFSLFRSFCGTNIVIRSP